MTQPSVANEVWRVEPASVAYELSRGRWLWAPHLALLSRKMAEIWQRPIRLLVSMPPRHGKSELSSHWLPVWFLNNWPNKRVILASYEADFAATWGRRVRNSVQDAGLVLVDPDSQAADRWETTAGGGMVTAGVGGPITGRGADLLVIDDPIKNAEEANSPTYRDKVMEWWQTTARTRLEPGASVVIIMTRWHVDDLIGRLLLDNTENWDYVSLPAIAEMDDVVGRVAGDPLWPYRYDKQALQETRQAIGEAAWLSLYQQKPSAVGGRNYFDLDVLQAKEKDCEPAKLQRYGGLVRIWRTPVVGARYIAGGDLSWGTRGAYSCLAVLDWRTGTQMAELYGRPPLEEAAQKIVELCKEYNNAYVGVERNGEGRVVVQRILELGYGTHTYYSDHDHANPHVAGWLTDGKTRPIMLSELEEATRNGSIVPRCIDAIREMRGFIRDDRGRPTHMEGHYDDHVMALAIAWQMRRYARWGSGQIQKLEYNA